MSKLIFLVPILFMIGCVSGPRPADGGGATLTHTEKITETSFNPVTSTTDSVTTEKNTKVVLEQPENPDKGGKLTVTKNPDGEVAINTTTSGSTDTASNIAAIEGLGPVTYTGLGMIVLGVLIGIFSKGRHLIASIILGVVGGGLIALAYLLPTFPFLFLIALGVAVVGGIGYVIYAARGFAIRDQAVDENINLIEGLKKEMSPKSKEKIFKTKGGLVDIAHSKSSRKLIDKKRLKK